MNLLEEYIPSYSGHIESIEYDEKESRIEIVFFDRPERFHPVLKLVFEGVTDYIELKIDEPEADCIELVIGLDLCHGGYCLHTDQREITFGATNVASVELKT